ncbi:MAG TPA: cytochrome c biogenesis protein CcdA, partial [Nitrososphaeraceae archaeon]
MRSTNKLASAIIIHITLVVTLSCGVIYNTTYAAIANTATPTATLVPPYHALTMNGKDVSMPNYRGKVVLLNTWATWCEPCRSEIPYLESLSKNFSSQGLKVIGVSIDSEGSDRRIQGFMKSYGMTYTVLRDPNNRFSHVFSTIGVPETLLIGRNGTILNHWKGPIDVNPANVEVQVKNALGLKNTQLNSQNTNQHTIGIAVAFVAGLLSFLSPCVLPLIPSYVTFITGLSLKEMTSNNVDNNLFDNSQVKGKITSQRSFFKTRASVITKGSLFILGFSLVFILLGSSVAIAGSLVKDAAIWISRIGGIIIVLFGLNMLGLLRIPRLERQFKFGMSKKPKHAGPLIVGITFGAGWTPCIGPILAGILTLAASSTSLATGALLLGAYSAGLAIPFIISAIAIDRFLVFFKKIRRWIPWIERTSGLLL